MAITDPRAIKFANEQVRPLAESLRAIKARIEAAKNDWSADGNAIAGLFAGDQAASDGRLEDGRDAEGVSRLIGYNVAQFMDVLTAVETAINDQIVALPCVRPLEVIY